MAIISWRNLNELLVQVSRGNRVKKKEMIKIKDFLGDNGLNNGENKYKTGHNIEMTEWTKKELVIPTGMKYRYFFHKCHLWSLLLLQLNSFIRYHKINLKLITLFLMHEIILLYIISISFQFALYYRYFIQLSAIKSPDISGRQSYHLGVKDI